MNRYVANFKVEGEADFFDAQNDTANFSTQEGLVSGANTLQFTKKYQNQA
jgi:hypothetical protein